MGLMCLTLHDSVESQSAASNAHLQFTLGPQLDSVSVALPHFFLRSGLENLHFDPTIASTATIMIPLNLRLYSSLLPHTLA